MSETTGPKVRNLVEFVGGPRDGDREEWEGWLGEEIHMPVPPSPIGARHVYRSAARSDHRDVFGDGTVVWRFEYRGVR